MWPFGTGGIVQSVRTWIGAVLRRAVASVLRSGAMPRHVAFIMDGNRRFADRLGLARQKGHEYGLDKLLETLSWCMELGIPEVTVYAWSIENFKRPGAEVDALMALAIEKFHSMMHNDDWAARNGVSVRVLGDVTLLPAELRSAIATTTRKLHAMSATVETKSTLNVCLAYTSRDEITRAVRAVATALQDGRLLPEDVDENLLEKCLFCGDSPDLLVRTSGEMRLSDFLLWQSAFSCFVCIDSLWPDLSFADLARCVLLFQRNRDVVYDRESMFSKRRPLSDRAAAFVNAFSEHRRAVVEDSSAAGSPCPAVSLNTH
eukprot:m51a1_g526 hypothetical protein (317) ;mRNA; f:361710-363377